MEPVPFSPAFADEMLAIFKDLHAHPELGFQEARTSNIVATKLREWNVDEVHTGIARTGVVGIIQGRSPGNRRIGLRADMDALPITEGSGLAYASTVPGLMHACGHDGHTTMLLGAARHLAATRNFAGKVILIFQPAEEGLGGARRMLADGLFDRFACDEIYGLHNLPQSRTGLASIRTGPMMAGAAFFDIELSGLGGHAARPHSARDTLAAAADLVGKLQTIVSRNIDPLSACVVSCTRIRAGSTYNVLPDHAEIAGTVRYFDNDVMQTVRSRMQQLCEGIAHAYQLEVSLDLRETFRPLVNAAGPAAELGAAAQDVLGVANVDLNGPMSMGSEDFADMLAEVPGAYIYLHHGDAAPLHSPGFQLDPAVLPLGMALLARLVGRRLKPARPGQVELE